MTLPVTLHLQELSQKLGERRLGPLEPASPLRVPAGGAVLGCPGDRRGGSEVSLPQHHSQAQQVPSPASAG